MFQRTVNPLLVLFSILGGIAGFLSGEAILDWGDGRIPNVVLIGVYFGQLALWVGFMCLLAEVISPGLNGQGWKTRYARDGWKMLLPASLVLLFVAGAGSQFLYGLHFGKNQPPQDILLAVDISESMKQTDPTRESVQAAKQLVQELDPDKRVAIIAFNDRAAILQPLVPVREQSVKDQVKANLDHIGDPIGGTDIGAALQKSMDQIEAAKDGQRKSMVILISDGYSEVNREQVLEPYQSRHIAVNTVGMNIPVEEGNDLLKNIASETGGSFHKIDDVQNVTKVVTKIYKDNQSWHLVGERSGSMADSLYFKILRIFFLLLIGTLMGLSLGIIFDNRFLAKSFSIGGTVAGLIAGLILETGLQGSSTSPLVIRAVADVVLAVVLALATAVVAYKRGSSADPGSGFYSRDRKGRTQDFRHGHGSHRDFQ